VGFGVNGVSGFDINGVKLPDFDISSQALILLLNFQTLLPQILVIFTGNKLTYNKFGLIGIFLLFAHYLLFVKLF
jgi:hypothetical protein